MFTGAELAGLCREAAITALREDLRVTLTLTAFASGLKVLEISAAPFRVCAVQVTTLLENW